MSETYNSAQAQSAFHVEHSRMSQIIAVCNQKGGVGKSTTAVNLGAYLALAGKRVLVVDLDAQGNATTACGVSRKHISGDFYTVLMGETSMEEIIQRTPVEQFDIVPSSLDLAGAESRLFEIEDKEQILRRLLNPLRERYDFILLDCPPSLATLTVSALVAADSTLIPVQCEYLALEGLNSLLKAIDLIRMKLNPSLHVGGILLTMTDFRANLTREVANEVRSFFKDRVFETSIPRNIRLAECPSFGKPICLYDPNSTGALAYHDLAQEVVLKLGVVTHDETARQGA